MTLKVTPTPSLAIEEGEGNLVIDEEERNYTVRVEWPDRPGYTSPEESQAILTARQTRKKVWTNHQESPQT